MLHVASAVLAGCGNANDLSERWTEGETRKYRYTVHVEGTHRSGSRGTMAATYETEEVALEVIPREQTLANLRLTRIAGSMQREGSETVHAFDSALEDSVPADGDETLFQARTRYLRRLSGVEFRALRKPSGAVFDFQNLERAIATATEGLPEADPGRELLTFALQPSALKFQFENHIMVPARPVPLGHQWDIGSFLRVPETTGFAAATLAYVKGTATLKSVTDGTARVEAEGRVTFDPPKGAPPIPQSMRGARDLLRLENGHWSGHALIDIATGRLEEAVMTYDLTGLVFVKLGGEGEVPIPQVVKRTIQRIE